MSVMVDLIIIMVFKTLSFFIGIRTTDEAKPESFQQCLLTSVQTYLYPVGLHKACGDVICKVSSRDTAHHHRHTRLTGFVALQLQRMTKLTV